MMVAAMVIVMVTVIGGAVNVVGTQESAPLSRVAMEKSICVTRGMIHSRR